MWVWSPWPVFNSPSLSHLPHSLLFGLFLPAVLSLSLAGHRPSGGMLMLIFITWDEERFPEEPSSDWQGIVLETLRASLFVSDSRSCQSRCSVSALGLERMWFSLSCLLSSFLLSPLFLLHHFFLLCFLLSLGLSLWQMSVSKKQTHINL